MQCLHAREHAGIPSFLLLVRRYVIICRSLFEQHKLMFSLLLAIKILQNQNMINAQEWRCVRGWLAVACL